MSSMEHVAVSFPVSPTWVDDEGWEDKEDKEETQDDNAGG